MIVQPPGGHLKRIEHAIRGSAKECTGPLTEILPALRWLEPLARVAVRPVR